MPPRRPMYDLLRPLLFRLDAERAHRLSLGAARVVQAIAPSLIEPWFEFERAGLYQSLWGLNFRNPVGLAAGFDKNARLVPFWERVGCGFVEVGSVSARPSPGNPRPRAFRLPEDDALINRMGLNNDGAERVAQRLKGTKHRRPLGINIVKTHDPAVMNEEAVADFRFSFRHLAPLADYIALNISCPNTREGKTFESADALESLLSAIFEERREIHSRVPVLLKLAPPFSARVVFDSKLEDIVAIADDHGIHGFIATNTTSDRSALTTDSATLERIGPGGLSGAPLAKRATRLVQYLYRATDGDTPIIGVGGVASAQSAYAKIRAGASLVQLYTGLIYEGPGLIKRIKEGLVELLERDGFSTIREAVGVDA